MNCHYCKHLQTIINPTYPPHVDYLCGAAVNPENNYEYDKQFKRDNDGLEINWIGKILSVEAPDWCPIKEGLIPDPNVINVNDETRFIEVKEV